MSEAGIEATASGFAVKGEMSFATVNRLLAASQKIFSGKSVVEIDLGQVVRADSAGLALLVEWLDRARRNQAEIRFLNMPGQMREIARMSEVDRILPKSDEAADAPDAEAGFEKLRGTPSN